MKESYEYKKLKEVALYSIGLTYKPSDVNDDGTIVLRSSNIQHDKLDLNDIVKVNCPIKESLYVQEGDILMCSRNGSAKLVGKVALIPKIEERMTYGTFMMLIRSVYNPYLFYFFKSETFRSQIKHGEANMINQITRYMLDDVYLHIPPLSEQQSIVDYLDSAFAKIDAMKANAEKALNEAKALFQASLKEMLKPKEGWEEKTLPEISENLDSIRKPVTKNKRTSGIYPYYGASGIVDYVDDYLFDEDLLCVSEDGANLLMRTYPIAFPISGKVWVNNHAHVLRFKSMITQKYVEYYFSGMKLDEYITGAAQPKLTQKALNSIIINIPISLGVQQQIVDTLDSLKSKVDRLQANFDKISQECDALKQAILRQVFE
ncbi:MAG: restriction endonuclease subunit S [Prevotella sp.]|nr:restriction endonuclease subunit S [Prevotella sp.]